MDKRHGVGREPSALDVIIVGGGAAGLRAASVLSEHHLRTVLFEARPRLGGRILTLNEKDWPIPVDLGAELIHGECPETMALLDGEDVREIPDAHFLRQPDGKLEYLPDFYRLIAEAGEHISRSRDLAAGEIIASIAGDNERMASLLRMFVEGYHAADPEKMSAHELSSSEDLPMKQLRPRAGFGEMIETLEKRVSPEVSIQCSTEVRKVEWDRGLVRVRIRQENEEHEVHAKRLIITVPLAVLQEGEIEFDPSIPPLEDACRSLETGHIVKIVLGFRTAFWNEPEFASRRLSSLSHPPLNFIHDVDAPYQTWWTMAPATVPILVAWAGGPAAVALSELSQASRLHEAFGTLSSLLEVDGTYLEEQLVDWRHHDWSEDPWSKGAYSYSRVDGDAARAALSAPVDDTLFFAGEALSADHGGTVEGALETGRNAARMAIDSLRRRESA